jgi:hypothetical protein
MKAIFVLLLLLVAFVAANGNGMVNCYNYCKTINYYLFSLISQIDPRADVQYVHVG